MVSKETHFKSEGLVRGYFRNSDEKYCKPKTIQWWRDVENYLIHLIDRVGDVRWVELSILSSQAERAVSFTNLRL